MSGNSEPRTSPSSPILDTAKPGTIMVSMGSDYKSPLDEEASIPRSSTEECLREGVRVFYFNTPTPNISKVKSDNNVRFDHSPTNDSAAAGITVRRSNVEFSAADRRQSTTSNFRRIRRNGASFTRRWSSRRRRRTTRRQSAFTTSGISEDDLDDLPLTDGGLLRCIPLRPHGLFVATVIVLCSLGAFLCSGFLLFTSLVTHHVARLEANCSTTPTEDVDKVQVSSLILHEIPKTEMNQSNRQGQDSISQGTSNCSVSTVLHYFTIHGSEKWRSDLVLWSLFCSSLVFLWSGAKLWFGIWNSRRRSLVPWLLVSGVSILCLICASVWTVICKQGWDKTLTLVPISLALIFLYWWMLINELLEEIHNEKKADFSAVSEFDAGISMGFTTTAASNGGRI